MYWALIFLVFAILLLGAGWLLHRMEKLHQKEVALLQKENDRLREIIRLQGAGRSAPKRKPTKEEAFLQEAKKLINEGFVNISSQTFRRRLMAAYDCTPSEYRNASEN